MCIRYSDRIRVGATGLADGTRRIFAVFCQLTVTACLAVWYGDDFAPDAALEGGAGRAQRQAENKGRVGQVGAQLAHRLGGQWAGWSDLRLRFEKVDGDDFVVATLHAERKAGGGDDGLIRKISHGCSERNAAFDVKKGEK